MIHKAIIQMTFGKASDPSGVVAEMMKDFGRCGIRILCDWSMLLYLKHRFN